MGGARWIGSFIAVIGLFSQSARAQTLAANEGDDLREQIVVFNSGKILAGRVTKSAGGCLIEQPDRRLWFQATEVKFVVNNMHEAYCKHRDSITVPKAETHLALAKWCLSYGLMDEARAELKKCLEINPEHKESSLLLEQLAEKVRPIPPPEVDSLGGLSKETAMEFTSKIQPLLLNKCGNAACHGNTSSNGFRLVGSRGGGLISRQSTERNLTEAMKQIDRESAGRSPLIQVAKSGHAGKGPIFGDPATSEQLKMLKTWTQIAAEEMQRKKKLAAMKDATAKLPR